jgi:polysaccharide pyruvyl transferase WcaK-like protein
MIIQIDGTNFENKGAELMMYAILEKLEERCPQCEVIFNNTGYDFKNPNTSLTIRRRPLRLKFSRVINRFISKIGLSTTYFSPLQPIDRVDIVLDASGFKLGDQWNYKRKFVSDYDNYYRKLKLSGTKVVLLPQALGPFETENAILSAKTISKFADLIFAREIVSYNHALKSGVPQSKLFLSLDFTNLVKGVIPERYRHLEGKVCLIPNKKMLTHSSAEKDKYYHLFSTIIRVAADLGFDSFLLNHGGKGDFDICKEINRVSGYSLEIVTDINAKEVKGVIGKSYLTFSSRYHGVASSLSQSVPCLATSWSHKYKLLFQDYEIENGIIDIKSSHDYIKNALREVLDPHANLAMRNKLKNKSTELERKTVEMWETVFKVVDL